MSNTPTKKKEINLDLGKRLILGAFLLAQTTLIAIALYPTCWLVLAWYPSMQTPLQWTVLIAVAILVFNYAYLIALLILRLLIPRTPEGYFRTRDDGRPSREAIIFMLNVLLMKARFQTPWAGIFSSVLVNLFPLRFPYRKIFGPDTSSSSMGDVCLFLDPYLLTMGKNVQCGFRSVISGHAFDNRGLLVKRVVIDDYAVVGGDAFIGPGVEIGHHAVVAARSLVMPNTIIGPYEYWGGTPAQKIKDLASPEAELVSI